MGEVTLYGSRAKGNFKVGSDIDLTIKGEGLSFSLLSSILEELNELPIPYSVDLSLFASINNPDLMDHIDRSGKVFYAREAKP